MVVAARGICFTAALELMLAADVRVAADDARFGQIEVKRGIYAVGGATIRFVQNIGWGNSRRATCSPAVNSAAARRIAWAWCRK